MPGNCACANRNENVTIETEKTTDSKSMGKL